MKTLEERFWAKVDKAGDDDCWNWTAFLNWGGYGAILVSGKQKKAHRVSYELHNGTIPKGDGYHGICVLHRCDNRSCVNPKHLFLGTHTDNIRDMHQKGRNVESDKVGEKNTAAKLTEDQARLIKRYSKLPKGRFTLKTVASLFGVCQSTVFAIKSNTNWSHL